MLREMVRRNRRDGGAGIVSVCSANPWVLEAAMLGSGPVLIEATSNQVNQFGGYTGQTPAEFAESVLSMSAERERILLGGDHLGPYPWRAEPAESAMQKACELVRLAVRAGFRKIHLDASMRCAGDPPGALPEETVARRAARLCQAAEQEGAPLYVIGTEVPVPGGEPAEGCPPAVTKPEDARRTLECARSAFAELGLDAAWERVIALVVQPGVEFGDSVIFDYDPQRARGLSENLPAHPELVYEAHSTDYQTPQALRAMVRDHFAILKVGPWLTFAFREAVFALSAIEREWLKGRRGLRLSRVRETLEAAMLANPAHWQPYYRNNPRLARRYSFSDRCRYYWPAAPVRAEIETLLANLAASPPPLALLSQYLPAQYDAVRCGALRQDPREWIRHRIRGVLEIYSYATSPDLPSGAARAGGQ